jgi:hypothetical protein
MKMSALTHREPTWKDTNAPVRARGYNKLSARICAERSRSDEGLRERHARACMRAFTGEIATFSAPASFRAIALSRMLPIDSI